MVSQVWNDWLATDLMEVTSIQLELVKQSNSQENQVLLYIEHLMCLSGLYSPPKKSNELVSNLSAVR